ncbi:MAG TPA: D-2-hydroxyacid dehydrogenase [Bryobacteraceae bacterium]|jgi:phosphoglycerate dehydrogenase-like enzyme|nr:D-2-hydroxyacid dehydrogenase [Bryobacteraceae bacterium]
MDKITVAVLANPNEPQLAMLEGLPPETGIAVGNAPEAFERAAPEASVIFNWSGSGALLREVLGMCPQVRWVHCRAAGLDDLLSAEVVSHSAILTNGTGVFSPPLGEFVLGAVIYFAKDFRRLIRNQMAGVWEPFDVTEIAGQTAGIVGYGDIGRAAAERLKAMGLNILALRRSVPAAGAHDPLVSRYFTPDALGEILPQCDYVVIAAPLTPETRGMLGAREFAAMKPTAVVINVGRGAIVDEAAMIDALTGKRILGAALDVFATEPLPAGHPFYKLENVLLSPHSTDHTRDWLERAMQFFLEQFARFAEGETLRNVVDKKRGY